MPAFDPVLELSSLNGANGFQINGEAAFDASGASVASAGDVNGDGFDDLIVGALGADPNGSFSGASYVVFGAASGFAANLFLSTLDGSNGFQISGWGAYDASGRSVSSAGDINGDGFADLIVGAPYADPNGTLSGASYVVFGKASGFGPLPLELSSLNGANGFQINGEAEADLSGFSVASAGDVNGDGFADLIIGANSADPNGSASGASYVVFGKASGFGPLPLELSSLNGANGFQINGVALDDVSGNSVASAGDVNGDGFDDLIIGARGADPNGSFSGASYVVFGKASGFGATLELSSLDGANGFQINGEAVGDQSGYSVASAGDVNGDGFDDIIIGANGAGPNGNNSGASYVVFGKSSGFGSTPLELSSLDGANGFQINGEAVEGQSGIAVASAGDVNGDGFDDLIIGAETPSGASYVVFGKAAGFAATLELSGLNGANGFQINGEVAGSGRWASSAGDVNGDGFDDLIIGAPNADFNGTDSGASYVIFGHATTPAIADFSPIDIRIASAAQRVAYGEGRTDVLTFMSDLFKGDPLATGWQIIGDGVDSRGFFISGGAAAFAVRRGDTVVISIRGSADGNDDVPADDQSGWFGWDIGADWYSASADPAGYYALIDTFVNGVLDTLSLTDKLIVTGHSLGGQASCVMAATDLATRIQNDEISLNNVSIFLFGSPGVPTNFRPLPAGLASRTLDLTNTDDAVPSLVPTHVRVGNAMQVHFREEDGSFDRPIDWFGEHHQWLYYQIWTDISYLEFFDDWASSPNQNGIYALRPDILPGSNDTFAISLALSGALVLGLGGDDLIYRDTNQVGLSFVSGGGGKDRVLGGAGVDYVDGGLGNDTISGRAGADHLWGGAGNDTLKGDAGADELNGGAGSDTASYVGAGAGVRVNLATETGLDSDAQGDTLTGIENLIGSAFNDQLIGDGAANTLNGAAGADTMKGFGGNDTYIVDSASDVTTEVSPSGGIDLVKSSVTRTLGAYLENLTLTGSDAINGIGNTLANILTGNSGANTLTGGAGADKLNGGLGLDRLTGGAGNDTFVFNAAPSAGNRDIVTDYNVAADTIQLENGVFVGLGGATGVMAASKFWLGSNAHDATDRIIYDSVSGRLYFDADGNGAGAKIHFATLDPGLTLTAADFVVI